MVFLSLKIYFLTISHSIIYTETNSNSVPPTELKILVPENVFFPKIKYPIKKYFKNAKVLMILSFFCYLWNPIKSLT